MANPASRPPVTPSQGSKNASYTMQRRLLNAQSHEFEDIAGFAKGYRNKEDQTLLAPGIMVAGSQNVLTNTALRVGIRKGYTLDGQADAALAPILGSYDWQRNVGGSQHLRSGFNSTGSNGKLQFRYVANAGDVWDNVTLTGGQILWIDILESLTSTSLNFASFTDEQSINRLLFVNGGSNVWNWSGGVATVAQVSNASGVVETVSSTPDATGSGYTPGDVLTIGGTTGVITAVNSTPTSGGFGYSPGDILTITTPGGVGGTVQVNTVDGSGTVLSVSFNSGGYGYLPGVGQQTNGGGDGNITGIIVTPGHQGLGYVAGGTATISGPGNGASISITGASEITSFNPLVGGEVTSFGLLNAGYGYTVATHATVANLGMPHADNSLTMDVQSVSTGTGCTIDITSVANYTGTGAQLTVLSTGPGGAVATYEITTPGSGYTVDRGYATTGGTGTGFIVQITTTVTGFLKISGTKTFAQLGFDPNNAGILVNGDSYSFSLPFGLGSLFLVGITPDVSGEPIGSVLVQQVGNVTNAEMEGNVMSGNVIAPPATGYTNDLIAVLYNQMYIGSLTDPTVYISVTQSYTDFKYNDPNRLPGDGASLTLDAPPTAFIVENDTMYISSGTSNWQYVVFTEATVTLATNITATVQSITLNRLKTTSLQASVSQGMTSKIKNQIIFISFEDIMNTLGIQANILNDPQTVDLSFPIVNDMDAYDFTNGQIIYFKQYIYFSCPNDGVVRIYNMTDAKNHYWEAPQILPIACFSIIDGELYGHSYQVGETYKLFDGYTDNGNAVQAIAKFSFNNYGSRYYPKSFNEYFVDGYIGSSTTLNLQIQYDLDGCATQTSYGIKGSDQQIVCILPDDNSLGKNSFGKQPLGGVIASGDTLPPYFHVIKTFPRVPFFLQQTAFQSDGIGNQWEILSFGPYSSPAMEQQTFIRQ